MCKLVLISFVRSLVAVLIFGLFFVDGTFTMGFSRHMTINTCMHGDVEFLCTNESGCPAVDNINYTNCATS